jgi:hypothetical protein
VTLCRFGSSQGSDEGPHPGSSISLFAHAHFRRPVSQLFSQPIGSFAETAYRYTI